MCPGEDSGGGSEQPPPPGGDGSDWPGGSGGPDIGAILAYLKNLGKDGYDTGNAAYGGNNIGPVGSRELEQVEDRSTALVDALLASPGRVPGGPQRPGSRTNRPREIEPFGGREAPLGNLFAFVGDEVDAYSGLPLGVESPDPFTGLPATDPFAAAERPARARRTDRWRANP
jgi:hypothetical protein